MSGIIYRMTQCHILQEWIRHPSPVKT